MEKKLYINAHACISAQSSFSGEQWAAHLNIPADGRFNAIEPDYKEWINSAQLRRTNRLTRMALASALRALKRTDLATVDAIVTATGYGCIESTYQFLERLFDPQNLPMNPSAFIQSTHNTAGSQLALQLQCRGYNNTVTANECAFELALDDAVAYLSESDDRQLLLGGFDEITAPLISILERLAAVTHTELDVGEGSAFFVLSPEKQENAIAINYFEMASGMPDARLRQIRQNYPFESIVVNTATAKRFPGLSEHFHLFDYATLVGNYPASGGFACWLACEWLQKGMHGIGEGQNIAALSSTKEGMYSLLILGK